MKAEFDSLKNNFQAQIDQYNTSIDSKIDGAIAQYLAGIKINQEETLQTFFAGEIETYSEDIIDRWWKPSQPKGKFTGTSAGASYEDTDYKKYTNPQLIQWQSVCNGKAGKQTVIKYNDSGTRDTSFPVFDFVGEGWYDNITYTSLAWMKNRNSFRPLQIKDAANGTRFEVSGSMATIRDGYGNDKYGQKTVGPAAWVMFPFAIMTTSTDTSYTPDYDYSVKTQSTMTPPRYKASPSAPWRDAYTPNGEHPLKTGISEDSILAKTSQTYTAKRQAALNYATSSLKLLVFDHEYDTGWYMPNRSINYDGTYDTTSRSEYPFWWKYGYSTPFDYWSAIRPDKWIFNFSYNDYQAEGPGKYGAIIVTDWSILPTFSYTSSMVSMCPPPLMAGWPTLMNMGDIYSNIKISTRTGPAPDGAVEKNGNFYLKWTAGTPLCYTPKAGNVKFDLISDSEVDLWVKLAPFNNSNPDNELDVLDRTKINLPASSTKNRAVRLPSGTSTVSFNVPSACYIFLKWGSTTDWKDGGKLTFPNDVTFTAD